ncbi:TorF family putative porin [Paraglaciecola sp. 25GB23A]|uniref:TorF family putative porin n=1 Tax=Paraglaciecola sp. 25GB23A TaxID=3156068 RepID=UPI0032AF9105
MKTLKLSVIAASVLAVSGFSSFASAEVSANFGATSNYLWRGVTQTGNAPSLSGGLDYSDESGVYAGTWVGTIDWTDETSDAKGAEVDFYAGYAGESGDFGYDVGYIYYYYPSTGYEDSNFGELYFNGSFGAFGFGVAYTINSEADNDAPFGTGDLYYNVSYGFDLPNEFALGLTYGYYDFDTPTSESDYGHFQVDLSKGDFTFSLSQADKESGSDDTNFVVSWGTSF